MQTAPILFGELPAFAAGRWPDSSALTYEREVTTFTTLDDQVDEAARALLARGISSGDKVGLWVTNRPEFIVAFFAIVKIGAVAVPLNTRYRQEDIRFVLRHAECKMLISVEKSGPVDYLEMLKEAVPGFTGDAFAGSGAYPHLQQIVMIPAIPGDGALSWQRLLDDAARVGQEALAAAAARVRPSDIALIVFTSGTTGNPKGVMHDHSNLRALTERAASWPLEHGDTVLNFLPMFHVYGLSEIVMASLVVGVHQLVMDAFDAERALHLIEAGRVNGLHGFETHYSDMLEAHERLKSDLSSLKFGTLPAGMENSSAVAERVQDLMCPTVTGFGMSECWAWTCWTTLADPREVRCGTSGRPMPGIEFAIVDPITGEAVPRGTVGEIVCRGYNVMRGYFRDPEATSCAIDAQGWLHSGDQGLLREDGTLWFLGRYKEMLKVGGENVSPAAVELELLRLVPSISQVAVVGFPDARLAEVPVAYVVPRAGTTCTLDQVQALCKGKIASFKIPRHVLSVAALPMTASGKVQRTVLKRQALQDIARH